MAILIDTSVLGRLANLDDLDHALAATAIADLHRRGEVLHVTPQNLVEFRNFATRPLRVNGLGLDTATVEVLSANFEANFLLLPETPDIYPAWKALINAAGVIGKQVHDARLAAVCHVHGVDQLLTFNTAHFAPLAAFGPGISVLHPADV